MWSEWGPGSVLATELTALPGQVLAYTDLENQQGPEHAAAK